MYPKGSLYSASMGVMEGQIRAISRHMEGQETSDSDPHQGKLQNHLAFCTHPDVHGFKVQICVYVTSPCLRLVRRTQLQDSNPRAKSPMNMCIQKFTETEC